MMTPKVHLHLPELTEGIPLNLGDLAIVREGTDQVGEREVVRGGDMAELKLMNREADALAEGLIAIRNIVMASRPGRMNDRIFKEGEMECLELSTCSDTGQVVLTSIPTQFSVTRLTAVLYRMEGNKREAVLKLEGFFGPTRTKGLDLGEFLHDMFTVVNNRRLGGWREPDDDLRQLARVLVNLLHGNGSAEYRMDHGFPPIDR